MFGATFVFPLIMGLNANLAIMMSGIATICFLLIVQGKVPSYLGTSASLRRRRHRDLHLRRRGRSGWPRGRHRRDPGGRRRARARRSGDPLLRPRHRQRGAAAGRHRRGRDADRLQPRSGRDQDLHAVGPVGRDHHDDRRDPDGGRPAWLLRPDRGLPRPDLRLPRSRGSSTRSSARPRCRCPATPSPAPTTASTGTPSRTPTGSASLADQGRPGRQPDLHAGNADVGWHLPSFSITFIAAGAAGRDRAGRREHRPRQGGRAR